MRCFILLLLCLSLNLFANEKVRFHKARTEAEKALDTILRIENGLDPDKDIRYSLEDRNRLKIKYEDCTTDGFRADEDKQQEKYEKENGCKNEDGDLCMFSETNHLTGAQDYITDVGFLYYTIEFKGEIYIYTITEELKDNPEVLRRYDDWHNYTIKKENGKWKIDGICFDHLRINHKYCRSRLSTYFPKK